MEFQKDQAIYLQIADLICENILSGEWAEEERIPSVRELAMTTEVNPNTVMRSYTWLQDKGIIQNQRGIGYFVAPGALEQTRNLKKEEFINTQLPYLFKMMDLLNISFDDLKTIHAKQQ
ncbi:MAG TPA: GntR family transcriptional regulator [Candidatus Marinimicrobia bacterium]|nr:GntR family transcriptional regulator [Candidatus Neomarinimicrobiota bacterium]